jgi:hypothetical protein
MMAQVTTQATQQKGEPTIQTTVERGKVVYVAGNDVVVKMENGEIRHITVPDSARATVDGKEVTIRDLRPGMKISATRVIQSPVVEVSEQRTVTGTAPPSTHPPKRLALTSAHCQYDFRGLGCLQT